METNYYNNVPTPSKESDKSLMTSVKYLFVGLAIFVLWGVLQIVDVQVDDRETYMQETIDEVGNSWSSDQILAGPVISYDRVTFVKSYGKDRHGKDSLIVRENSTTNLLFPEDLLVKCDVDSKSLHRSIYDVSVYSTKAEFSGKFTIPEELLGPDVRNIRVRMSVSDLKGIFEQVFVNLDTVKYQLNPNEGASSSNIQSDA